MAGLYVHIPWCKQVCYYCDFHFRVSMNDKSRILAALRREIELRSNYLGGSHLSTLYFGGGTPSLLQESEWVSLFETIRRYFLLDPHAEITVEVNPDDLTPSYLAMLLALGVNRLSIGVQSFNNDILHWMNRRHSAEEAENAVRMAHTAGFRNLSIDLMYAVPGMSLSMWNAQIEQAMRLPVMHISAYSLSIEPATPFGVFLRKGRIEAASEELAAQHFLHLMDRLPAFGFEWYEIANFSRPGFESRHNSSYWHQEIYLGVGPSAHSYDLVSRQWNVSVNSKYAAGIERGEGWFERELLTPTDCFHDYLLTALRTRRGVDLEYVASRFGELYRSRLVKSVEPFLSDGSIEARGTTFCLTPKGMLLADRITRELFL